jgi:hypothetical protein
MTFLGLLFMSACAESMIANVLVGNAFATFSVAAAIRNPLATMRSYFWRASDVRFGT